jgi:hypothetical protein
VNEAVLVHFHARTIAGINLPGNDSHSHWEVNDEDLDQAWRNALRRANFSG